MAASAVAVCALTLLVGSVGREGPVGGAAGLAEHAAAVAAAGGVSASKAAALTRLAQKPRVSGVTALQETVEDFIPQEDRSAFPEDVLAAINASANPCDDFYEYSCGAWIANTTIPSFQPSWAKQWDGVNDEVQDDVVELLKEDKGPAGKMFRSCMDVDAIDKAGAGPILAWVKSVDKIVDRESLDRALVEFAIADLNVFWSWWVDADSVDSTINSFFLAEGGTTMPDRSYYLDKTEEMKGHRAAYRKLAQTLLTLAGRSPEEAKQDTEQMLQIETALAKAQSTNAAARDEHGERVSPEEFYRMVPEINWKGWFDGLGLQGLGTQKGGYLVVRQVKFLKAVSEILSTSSMSNIRAYMRWKLVHSYAPTLSIEFEDALLAYNKELVGISVLPPRVRKCYFTTEGAMDMRVSKLFTDKYLQPEARDAALEMLSEIRDQFNASLRTKTWMDEAARTKGVEKLEKMFLEVGYPTVWPPSTTQDYKEFGGVSEASFFDNRLSTNAYMVKHTLAKMGKKVHRRNWGSSSAVDVNSYYNRKVNGIFIPAGILQPHFYSPSQAPARNYGSVGAICGHEMTHGFDDVGSEYDGDGNRNGWWSAGTVAAFKERAKCIEDLFSSYELYGAHVNGKLTLGEAIADAGGVKYAWESFVKRHAPSESDKRLFFVAMGQTWCSKVARKGARESILTDEHPPEKFRVIGTLSQFAPFGEAFGCPAGAPMNPESKCHLW
jgi:putative endopeptidase